MIPGKLNRREKENKNETEKKRIGKKGKEREKIHRKPTPTMANNRTVECRAGERPSTSHPPGSPGRVSGGPIKAHQTRNCQMHLFPAAHQLGLALSPYLACGVWRGNVIRWQAAWRPKKQAQKRWRDDHAHFPIPSFSLSLDTFGCMVSRQPLFMLCFFSC